VSSVSGTTEPAESFTVQTTPPVAIWAAIGTGAKTEHNKVHALANLRAVNPPRANFNVREYAVR
jgi:hypothetical protein